MNAHHALRRAATAFVALATVAAGVLAGGGPSVAATASAAGGATAAKPTFCGDVTPPTLLSFGFTPKQIDARRAAQKVHVTVRATDGLTGDGVRDVMVFVQSPTIHGIARYLDARLTLTSGTALKGTWTGVITIPRFTNNGTWTVTEISLQDQLGNPSTTTTGDLTGGGFPTTFDVLAHPDLIRPKVRDFAFSPRHPDSTHGAKRVRVSATVTDRGGSRLRFVQAAFGRDDPTYGHFGRSLQLKHQPGTNHYVGFLTVPVRADRESPAVWDVNLSVVDHATNVRGYTTGDLHTAGWPSMLTVTNKPDPHVPQITALSFHPKVFDTSAGPVLVHVVARFADLGKGVRAASIGFSSANPGNGIGVFQLTKGTIHDGTWRSTVQMPRCSSGVKAAAVVVVDRVGNAQYYSDTDLTGLGLPAYLTATAS